MTDFTVVIYGSTSEELSEQTLLREQMNGDYDYHVLMVENDPESSSDVTDAIRKGLERGRGDSIVLMRVGYKYPPNYLQRMYELMKHQRMVIGHVIRQDSVYSLASFGIDRTFVRRNTPLMNESVENYLNRLDERPEVSAHVREQRLPPVVAEQLERYGYRSGFWSGVQASKRGFFLDFHYHHVLGQIMGFYYHEARKRVLRLLR